MTEPAIFVFGSNLAGRHGKGAALHAKLHHGAIQGQGVGLQGNSWAIPTKDHSLRVLGLKEIGLYVAAFLTQASVLYPDRTFAVTPIGCGLAGYTPAEIAPLFRFAPKNVILPEVFVAELAKVTPLDAAQSAAFVRALQDPVKPNDALKAAAARYKAGDADDA
jgi:hypothetical protein